MKTFIYIAFIVMVAGCDNIRRNPGRDYMPDMRHSRAYETYAQLDSSRFTRSFDELGEGKIFYNAMPVAGTQARGDLPTFPFPSDSAGYNASTAYPSPLTAPDSLQIQEGARLYNVNCGICHGSKLDGKGPLFVSGKYPAAPRNLMEDAMKAQPPGQTYHVITYGKGQMGSYASQLNSMERWMVIAYIKSKQAGGATSDTTQTQQGTGTGVTTGGTSTSTNQNTPEDTRKN